MFEHMFGQFIPYFAKPNKTFRIRTFLNCCLEPDTPSQRQYALTLTRLKRCCLRLLSIAFISAIFFTKIT